MILFKLFLFLVITFSFFNAQATDKVARVVIKYEQWLLGSQKLDFSNEHVQFKYKRLLALIEKAHQRYDSGRLKYSNRNQRTKVWQNVLLPLATSYQTSGEPHNPNPDYHSPFVKRKIVDLFNKIHASGWNETQKIGWGNLADYEKTGIIGAGGSYSNRMVAYAVSVFLMRDVLKQEGLLERELKTLNYATEVVSPKFDRPILWEVNGFNTDHLIAAMQSRLCYILSLPAGKEREVQMNYHWRLSNKALKVADGFADFIKSDFTTNHHKNTYVSTYGNMGLQAASVLTYILNKTEYQLEKESATNVFKAMLAARIYSNKYSYHRGIAGRSGDFSKSINLAPFYALLATIESPYQKELQGAFLRYWDPSYSKFKSELLAKVKAGKGYYQTMGTLEIAINQLQQGGTAEKAPNGHWYFHHAGMSVHRQKEWAVLWKGIGKYLWDYEGPVGKHENIYGKYAGAGALTILNGGQPISEVGSGIAREGWDWRRIPGTTALNESYEKMPSKNDRQFSKNFFVGGVFIDENNGMSSMQYIANRSSLKAKKSVFYFDEYIVALGSAISSKNENYKVHTTLFQTALQQKNQTTFFNGEILTKETSLLVNQPKEITVIDAVNNAFYLPNGKNFILERSYQTAPDHTGLQTFSKHYVSGRILHGLNPKNASYEYYIHVDGGQTGVQSLQKNVSKLFKILKSDQDAHIVHYQPNKVTAYAIMNTHPIIGTLIRDANVPSMVMTQELNNNQLVVAVMNPELGKILKPFEYKDIATRETWHAKPTVQPVMITIQGQWKIVSGADAQVVESDQQQTKIQFNCVDGKRIKVILSAFH